MQYCTVLSLYSGSRTNGFAPSSPEIGMHVEIRDPEDKIILSKVSADQVSLDDASVGIVLL